MRRVVLLFLLLAGLATAKPSVEARIDSKEDPLPFGKPAELVLTLSWPETQPFQPPDAGGLEIPGATVLDRFVVDEGTDGAHRRQVYHLVFTRLEPGEFEVPSLNLGAGVSSPPVKFTFAGSTPLEGEDPEEIRPLKPVVPLSTADFWKKVGKGAGGLSGLLLLFWILSHYLGVFDRFRSPKARAVKQLKRLDKNRPDPETLLLSSVQVMRNYLNQAYNLRTQEATTREILDQMTMDNRLSHLKGPAEGLFVQGDAVKFAGKGVSGPEAADQLHSLIASLQAEKKVPKL